MADMGKDGGSRPWWQSNLDWSLAKELETTLRMGRAVLRNIPQTLSAYRLGKASPLDELEPDPVEKIGASSGKTTQEINVEGAKKYSNVAQAPRVIPPPPPPPPPAQWGVRAVNMPSAMSKPAESATATAPAEPRSPESSQKLQKLEKTLQEIDKALNRKEKLTLEKLLDPNFCDY